jgi:type VI secretion system protein VasJ
VQVVDSGPVVSAEDAERVVESGFGVLRNAADYLLENEPANPLGYRIARWIAWSRIGILAGDESGTTFFPPPDPHYVGMLASTDVSSDPLSALRFAEAQFAENPLWLDLNCCTARALQALGDDYAAAAQAVLAETALVAARLKGGTLRFSDGTPFAAPETLAWLSEAGAGANAEGATASTLSGEVGGAMKKAAELAGAGDILGAAGALQRGIARAANAGERFQARLKLGEYVVNAQAVANPWPFVQPLLEDLDRHRLDEWDPVTTVAALRTVIGALAAAGEAAPPAPTIPEVLRRIALLDYAEALRLSGAQ